MSIEAVPWKEGTTIRTTSCEKNIFLLFLREFVGIRDKYQLTGGRVNICLAFFIFCLPSLSLFRTSLPLRFGGGKAVHAGDKISNPATRLSTYVYTYSMGGFDICALCYFYSTACDAVRIHSVFQSTDG